MRFLLRTVLLLFVVVFSASAAPRTGGAQISDQQPEAAIDSDQDGMSDALEQALLVQFAPRFMIDRHDCSRLPAEFKPGLALPTVNAEDGTIYGQVIPAKSAGGALPAAEIHFYHLWARDCGAHGHALDAEHVSVLVTASDRNLDAAKWKALYWYAAAHEDTVCDVSQIARASTLHAELAGATIFISPGKHASYFNETLCKSGCGADKCVEMVELQPARIINLGEPGHTMNGSAFTASNQWPLIGKMSNTNFPAEPIARLNQLPDSEIVLFNPGKHPAQGIIAISSSTQQAIGVSAVNTTSSVALAGKSTGSALSTAQGNTGDALRKSAIATGNALGATVKHVGEALHLVKKPAKTE
jgi:hypothetical protein